MSIAQRRANVPFIVAMIKSILPSCRNWTRFEAVTGTSSSFTPKRLATSAASAGSDAYELAGRRTGSNGG